MSLINDALKKAQRDRSGPSGPGIEPVVQSGALPPQGYHVRPAPGGSDGLGRGLVLGAVIALALVGGGAAVWWLKSSPAKPASAPVLVAVAAPAPTPAPVVSAPPPTPVVSAPPPITVAPVATATPTAAVPPATSAPPAPPAPPPFQLRLNLPASTPPAAAEPSAPGTTRSLQPPVAAPAPGTPAPAATAGESFQIRLNLQDPRILAFLDSARINGIRAAADDAKLLMNNKVFKAGDIVDRALKLKLTKVEPGVLTFEDGQGQVYVKPF